MVTRALTAILGLSLAGLGGCFASLLGGCVVITRGDGKFGFGLDTTTEVYAFSRTVHEEEQVGKAEFELKGSLADALVGRIEAGPAPAPGPEVLPVVPADGGG